MAERKNNDRINNAQRQNLAKIAEEAVNRRLQKVRMELINAESRAADEVKKELGITAIDGEIESLQERINELEREKEKLGFDRYRSSPTAGSKAKGMIAESTRDARERLRALEEERADIMSGIWSATTLSQALSIFNKAKGL